MTKEEKAFHQAAIDSIEARAAVIFAQVKSGEKSRKVLKTARDHMAQAEKLRCLVASWEAQR